MIFFFAILAECARSARVATRPSVRADYSKHSNPKHAAPLMVLRACIMVHAHAARFTLLRSRRSLRSPRWCAPRARLTLLGSHCSAPRCSAPRCSLHAARLTLLGSHCSARATLFHAAPLHVARLTLLGSRCSAHVAPFHVARLALLGSRCPGHAAPLRVARLTLLGSRCSFHAAPLTLRSAESAGEQASRRHGARSSQQPE